MTCSLFQSLVVSGTLKRGAYFILRIKKGLRNQGSRRPFLKFDLHQVRPKTRLFAARQTGVTVIEPCRESCFALSMYKLVIFFLNRWKIGDALRRGAILLLN